MGFLWLTGFSFFHCVASPFHSFVRSNTPNPKARLELFVSGRSCDHKVYSSDMQSEADAANYLGFTVDEAQHAATAVTCMRYFDC